MAASTERMNLLIKKRETIEAEIKALNEVLDSQQNVGMKESLVDVEGFPRADVDVYTVRHARHQINCLQNDYTDVMKEIEEELYNIHATARANQPADDSLETEQTRPPEPDRLPIGTVKSIDEGSPADRAGLKVGDSILQFGSLQKENFQGLQNIASVVQHSIDSSIPLVVKRGDAEHKFSIVPTRWKPNKGLLGCNITPH